jgi:hypothetical protein
MNAILKQFAPIAVIPPSPNNSACITNAILTAIVAAHGPNRIAVKTAPTACPVVPPGIGILNIIITKENAAPIASNGTCFVCNVFFNLFDAIAQTGIIITNPAAQVTGPK